MNYLIAFLIGVAIILPKWRSNPPIHIKIKYGRVYDTI